MFKRKKKELKINDNLIPKIVDYKIKYKIRFRSNDNKEIEIAKDIILSYLENSKVTSERIAEEIYIRFTDPYFGTRTIIDDNKLYVIDEIYNIEIVEFEKIEKVEE